MPAKQKVTKRDTVPAKQKVTNCTVAGDSALCNVGAEHADMKVECFPGVKIEQLHRMVEKCDKGSTETDIIHVRTDDLRSTKNLDFGGYGEEEIPELQTCSKWSVVT